MDIAVAPRSRSLPIGIAASIGLHLLAAIYVLVTFSHPQPLAPPVDLSNAIAISMEPFRPTPPKPPQPQPKPQAPKDVVKSTAPEPDAQIAEKPAEPSPPQESQPSTSGAPSYASIVAGIIQRAKRYPRDALIAEQQGVVQAYFVVNHQGHVIGYRIEKASGVASLDREVTQLLKRVRFPPIPDDGGDPERREFSLPIAFLIEG